jgi:hypothetical protein
MSLKRAPIMKTILFFVSLVFPLSVSASAPINKEAIVMKPFTVTTSGIESITALWDKNSYMSSFLITKVVPGSAADRAGVKAGMFVIEMNGKSLKGLTRREWEKRLQEPVKGDFFVLKAHMRNPRDATLVKVPLPQNAVLASSSADVPESGGLIAKR